MINNFIAQLVSVLVIVFSVLSLTLVLRSSLKKEEKIKLSWMLNNKVSSLSMKLLHEEVIQWIF